MPEEDGEAADYAGRLVATLRLVVVLEGCWLLLEIAGYAGRLLAILGRQAGHLASQGDSFPVVHAVVYFLT